MIALGVDYASVDADGPPDWAMARDAGVRFVAIRGTYEKWVDPTYKRDHQAARDAGLVTGAYLFPVMGHGHPPAAEQVATFAGAVGTLSPEDLPPALDIEFPGGISRTGLDRAGIMAWIREAVGELEQAFGVKPMLYTSARVWDDHDIDCLGSPTAPDLVDCPLWLARYPFKTRIKAQLGMNAEALPAPPVPKPWGDAWFIHQFQGDAVGFPGFTSTVDINRFVMMSAKWPVHDSDRVRWVQRRLGIEQSGTIDADTDHAIHAFQIANGLGDDGVIGIATFAALCWAR